MGFFSWNCNGCGHPAISKWASNKDNEWMEKIVVFKHGEKLCEGIYDGYGRVVDEEGRETEITWLDGEGERELYHQACFKALELPRGTGIESERAGCQGYFFNRPLIMKEPVDRGDMP